MNSKLLLGAAMFVLCTLVALAALELASGRATEPARDEGVSVSDVVARPRQFMGKKLELRAAVVSTVPGKSIIVVTDLAEVEAQCGVSCVSCRMPVEVSGKVPPQGSRIILRGEVVEQEGKYLFHADEWAQIP